MSAVDPEAWATARDAARRSGLSVGEWLESAIRDSAGDRSRAHRGGRETSLPIERRLDDIAERLDFVARGVREPDAGSARHGREQHALLDSIESLNERIDALVRDMRADHRNGPADVRAAIQRLDDRIEDLLVRGRLAGAGTSPELERKLDDISRTIEGMSRRLEQENTRYAASPVPPTVDELDAAVAEIMMRQSALDGTPPRDVRGSPGRAVQPAPDFSRLESQLKTMADEMHALRRASIQTETVDALRREVSTLAGQLSELAPRRSIEGLERTIESLALRFDRLPSGHSDDALADVAHTLHEIRSALADVRPAESFASVEKDLHDLSNKLDGLSMSGVDGSTVMRLQEQTAEIRDLLSGALPSEVLKALVEQIEILLHKFETNPPAADNGILDVMAAFDRRIEGLAERIDAASHQGPGQAALDDIRARLDEVQRAVAEPGRGSTAGVEESVRALTQKVEAAEQRLGNLGAIERGLNDLFAQLQDTRANAQDVAERAARSALREMPVAAAGAAEKLRRPLGELETKYSSAGDSIRAASAQAGAAMSEARPAPIPVRASALADAAADVPPDLPLEPGSGAPRMRMQSAALRVAQSEAALGGIGAPQADTPSRTSDFIAAARRAAQQASAEPAADRAKDNEGVAGTGRSIISRFGGMRRALLIALTAFLIIFTALRFFDTGIPALFQPAPPAPTDAAPEPSEPARPGPEEATPTKPKQDSSVLPTQPSDAIAAAPPAGVIGARELPFLGETAIDPTTTGTAAKAAIQTASTPPTTEATGEDKSGLPAALGSASLRAAAAAGDPAAAYEIGTRYLEGRGVRADTVEAARWLKQALAKGSAPAAYRLGNIYEKGHGAAKNSTEAIRYYKIGAEGGNIKAMHNLAVMYAEGPDGKPDYKTAIHWFRMGAERGVRDSQFNLGVLYARGLGVEQNLAESYRWFALAANQGDNDAAKKRDDVARRLDVQSLVAAKLAVQTWTKAPVNAAANEVGLKPEWEKAETSPRKKSLKK